MQPSKSVLAQVDVVAVFALALALVPLAFAAPKYDVLHAFTGGNDGGGLWDSLLFDKQRNLYGTTYGGGAYGYGTVFKLAPHTSGKWSETVLHSFNFHKEGAAPTGGLIFGVAGRIYGTAPYGGLHDGGSVFELTRGSRGWTERVIYSFGAHANDAYAPYAGLVMDRAGNLYGTGHAVFELSFGSDGWEEKVLHRFTRSGDGGGAFAGLVADPGGDLYGTTEGGGAHNAGTVYQIRHTSGNWKESVLHSFPAFPNDGGVPGVGALVSDISGNLYGTTNQGGSHICIDVGCGTVFRLTRETDGNWTETILYNFVGDKKGSGPGAGVVMDKKGNLYGTTVYGGSPQCGCGVVYELSPGTQGKWKYKVLHTFTGSDGAQPDANLILDKKGNLYGTTATGGAGGAGVAFKLTP